MSEAGVKLLMKASSVVSQIVGNDTLQILNSYYLLRCKELSRSSGLALKQFSHETRCSYCLNEWKKETETKLNPIKLSKRQRRRIRSKAKLKKFLNKECLLHSNKLVKVCSFCSHSTQTSILKPNETLKQIEHRNEIPVENIKIEKKRKKKKETKQNQKQKETYQSNVYCKSKVAFSLSKKMNNLPSIKESTKIIKNNNKKKDKFAGLCQTAVLAATKLKQEKEKQNKLNLFLKPAA